MSFLSRRQRLCFVVVAVCLHLLYALYINVLYFCPNYIPSCRRQTQIGYNHDGINMHSNENDWKKEVPVQGSHRKIHGMQSTTKKILLQNINITVTSLKKTGLERIKTMRNDDEFLQKYQAETVKFRRLFSCAAILNGSKNEIENVENYHRLHRPTDGYPSTPPEYANSMFFNCETYRTVRGYVMEPGSPEEKDFPLAYVILAHRDIDHLERLLRILYRPQHVFCIHLDQKVADTLKQAVSRLTSCFPNVFLASHPVNVVYAHMSRLMADYVCMKDLVEMRKPWKYLINMAATAFPLLSNRETVQILKLLKGKNDIHEVFQYRKPIRWKMEYIVKNGRIWRTTKVMPPPPYNLTVLKGQAYNAFSREFLTWVMVDRKPRDFLHWSRKTYSPDEHYWATLNNMYHNPQLKAPGGFRGHPDKKGYITMAALWSSKKSSTPCHGLTVHNLCVFGSGDLNYITQRKTLTANKFDLAYDPVAYSCMEELLENKTLEAKTNNEFDLTLYKRLYFIVYDPDKEKRKNDKTNTATTVQTDRQKTQEKVVDEQKKHEQKQIEQRTTKVVGPQKT